LLLSSIMLLFGLNKKNLRLFSDYKNLT